VGLVVLITGPPAVGKTTLSEYLSEHVSPIHTVDYGSLLLDTLEEEGVDYETMRAESAGIIPYNIIRNTDKKLIERINDIRSEYHVLIDSHPITKERYGYRSAHYDVEDLDNLGLDIIIVLHCKPSEIVKRIESDPEGRHSVSENQVRTHTFLQDSVAVTYGVISDCPVYFLDSNQEINIIAKRIMDFFDRADAVYAWSE